MKLQRLYLFLPCLGLVLSRDVFGIAEQPILHREADRKKQDADRIQRPVSVKLHDLLEQNRQKRQKSKQDYISDTRDPRSLISTDQPAEINGIVRDRRQNDDRYQDEKM